MKSALSTVSINFNHDTTFHPPPTLYPPPNHPPSILHPPLHLPIHPYFIHRLSIHPQPYSLSTLRLFSMHPLSMHPRSILRPFSTLIVISISILNIHPPSNHRSTLVLRSSFLYPFIIHPFIYPFSSHLQFILRQSFFHPPSILNPSSPSIFHHPLSILRSSKTHQTPLLLLVMLYIRINPPPILWPTSLHSLSIYCSFSIYPYSIHLATLRSLSFYPH